MSNVFIGKTSAPKPSANVISDSQYAQYNSNLVLAGLINTSLPVKVFEALRLGGKILTAGVSATILPNDIKTATLVTTAGSGTNVAGLLTSITTNWAFYIANKYYLSGSRIALGDSLTADIWLEAIAASGLLVRLRVADDEYDYGTPPTFANGAAATAAVVSGATGEIAIQLADDAVNFLADSAIVDSIPRTYTATVTDGTAALTMTSSGANAGSALPFSTDDALQLGATVGAGSVNVVTAPFGSSTTYAVKTGTVLGAVGTGIVADNRQVNIPLSIALADYVVGGVGTLIYKHVSGALPSGVVLTGSLISGTPLIEGSYSVQFSVTDEIGQSVIITVNFTVVPIGNYYYAPPAATSGIPYNYNPKLGSVGEVYISSGALPNGLTLNADTGVISGTPTESGSFDVTFGIESADASTTESIDATFVSYDALTAELWLNNVLVSSVTNNEPVDLQLLAGVYQLRMSNGSGSLSYSVTGGNQISSNGTLRLVNTGDAQVTITDTLSGEQFRVFLLISGIKNICGLGITETDEEDANRTPCKDVIVECGKTARIAFNALTIVKNVEVGDTQYEEPVNFIDWNGGNVSNNGKPFAMLSSLNAKCYAVADNFNGSPMIVQLALDNSVMNAANDCGIGLAENFSLTDNLSACSYAFVFTTVSAERVVQIWKDGVYQEGTQVSAGGAGYEFSFGFFGDMLAIYRNGILSASLAIPEQCGGKLVFVLEGANQIFGGKVTDLVYSILTDGNADTVGTVDAQTGDYTPAEENLPLVTIQAVKTSNTNAIYTASVRVIHPAAMSSLNDALLEGAEVKFWITDIERKDNNPVRFSADGRPDAHQFGHAVWLGNLQGSAKAEPQTQNTDFNDDNGQTSTSMRIQSFNITGVFLQVRDFNKVKRLVPFLAESNSNGVRRLRQYAAGCLPRMRVLIIWQNPHCKDVKIFDCLEFFNVRSYTTLNLEMGSQVQSNIPLVLKAFPDDSLGGALLDYNQMRENYTPLD